MAQQGPPPGRSSGRPGSRDRGSERSRQEWLRRSERPEAVNWRQLEEAFRQDTDPDLPPWAGPNPYQRRAAGTASRPGPSRPQDPRTEADHAGQEGQPGSGYRGRRRGADADAGLHDGQDAYPAGLDDYPEDPYPGQPADAGSGPVPRRIGRRGRAAAARLRKSRRRVVRWCVGAIAACVVAAVVVALVTHHAPVKAAYVTSLQAGEYKAAPDACSSVSAATLGQYLPGPGLAKSVEQSGSAESQCSFTVDHKPDFLVLQVTSQQYQPLAAASGDGSASDNAQDNLALAQQALVHPVKHSPLTAAQISPLTKLGQKAVVAVQSEHVSGISTELVTVLLRERNVLITVSLSGQESGHGFGPAPVQTLEAGATAAAKEVLAKLSSMPKA